MAASVLAQAFWVGLTGILFAIPVVYALREGADSPGGPFSPVQDGISIPNYGWATLTVPNATNAYYRLVRAAGQ